MMALCLGKGWDFVMDSNSFYGDSIYILESALDILLGKIDLLRNYRKNMGMHDPVEHRKGRIKSEDSMIEKLTRKGLSINVDNALHQIHDAVGVRIVCSFVNDVYDMVNLIKSLDDLEVIKEKDFIANPKPNGYRSYHIIVKMKISTPEGIVELPAEIQLRTIAQDSWEALEHQLKYKKNISNVELIQSELKRCADEMASTDLTLQTVREMINSDLD